MGKGICIKRHAGHQSIMEALQVGKPALEEDPRVAGGWVFKLKRA